MAIGDRLRTRIKIWGAPSCVNTAKCLMTAADKGVDIEALLFDPASSEIKTMSPLGLGPVLRDVDHVVFGTSAILSYLDDKGFGNSLMIRNGVVRAKQWELSQMVTDVLQNNMGNREVVLKCLDFVDARLQSKTFTEKGDFVCGQFSLADVHLAACVNKLIIDGQGDLVNSHSSVSGWLECVKAHTATSKDKVVPYDSLPTSADVQSGQLRDVVVNVGS